MNRDNPTKHFILAFVIAVLLYVITYGWIEHRRNRKGPWEITFTNNCGAPAMIINQPWLGLTNVRLVFQGETALATTNTPRIIAGDPSGDFTSSLAKEHGSRPEADPGPRFILHFGCDEIK